MKLQEVLKGMCVKDWEVREDSKGRKKVYVRFHPKQETQTVKIESSVK